jgi:hypothetical protein
MALRSVQGTVLVLLVAGLLAPAAVAAQQQPGGIAGLVRDTSGAVLPGVSVEASSPALIERVRAVATDAEGRYSIVNLPPGSYVVTFTLTGFNTIRREGVQLTSGFTANVSVEMQVGSLQETVTVSGASPIVDTQNVTQQNVLSSSALAALPTGTKSLDSILAITPGLSGAAAGVGGAQGTYRSTSFNASFHGKINGGKANFDGLAITNTNQATGAAGYIINGAMVEEMVLEGGGASAESNVSAFSVNFVPKQGGNTFRGLISGTFADEALQADNLTQELRDRGLTSTSKVLRQYDIVPTFGGPIKKDKLWFFYGSRWTGLRNQWAGIYANKTIGTTLYTPDLNDPASRKDHMWSHGVRLTWQISEKSKLNIFADPQHNVTEGSTNSIVTAPEAVVGWDFTPQGLYQVTWASPRTSRFLLEAGASFAVSAWPQFPLYGASLDKISLLETTTAFRYNGSNLYVDPEAAHKWAQRFVASYVTGSHTFKAGLQYEQGFNSYGSQVVDKIGFHGERIPGNVSYDLQNGAPIRVWEYASPFSEFNRIRDMGLFAQDQWAIKRLTISVGLRYDYFYGYVPAQTAPASAFLPARSYDAVNDIPNWKDLNPRAGVSYDVFGNGRTAVKTSIGRYVNKPGVTVTRASNPLESTVNQVSRTWTDANGNFFPDCDLRVVTTNSECGQVSDLAFGQLKVTTKYDSDVLRGFQKRESLWDLSAEVQQQISQNMSLTAGYYHNWGAHFLVTDNQLVTPADFDPYSIAAPVDPRLPNGGGYLIDRLYDVKPAKFGLADNFVTFASNFGNQKRINDFFSVTFDKRASRGLQFGGGVDTGTTLNERCFVVDSPQELLNCSVRRPFSAQTQLKLNAAYTLPWDFTVSGIFRNEAALRTAAGGEILSIEANYAAPNAIIAPSLGRNLAACGARVPCTAQATVPLFPPYQEFEGRLNQLDFRFTKRVTLTGRSRVQLNVDLYNALNRSPVVGVNTQYGSRWLVPSQILDGRLIQFSGNYSF